MAYIDIVKQFTWFGSRHQVIHIADSERFKDRGNGKVRVYSVCGNHREFDIEHDGVLAIPETDHMSSEELALRKFCPTCFRLLYKLPSWQRTAFDRYKEFLVSRSDIFVNRLHEVMSDDAEGL